MTKCGDFYNSFTAYVVAIFFIFNCINTTSTFVQINFRKSKLIPFGMLKFVIVALNMPINLMLLRVNLQHNLVGTYNVFACWISSQKEIFCPTYSWYGRAISPFCKRLTPTPTCPSQHLISQAGICGDAASRMSWVDFPFRDSCFPMHEETSRSFSCISR